MACFYRIVVRDVRDKFLTCFVTELARHEDRFLVPSPSLAFGFLWDTLGYEGDYDTSYPLMEVVAGRSFFGDYDWTATTAEQIVSCVGLTDYRVGVADEWSHMTPGNGAGQATFNIAVTDKRWLEHLATNWESSKWEWESTLSSVTALPTINPGSRTPSVLALAQQIADTQEFSAFPALADALQAAGCDNEYVLEHCRGPGPHACGCWALDLILGNRWMTCNDPEAMIRELGYQLDGRKLRLFAAACCRRVEAWAELADPKERGDDYRNAILVAERFADGTATATELADAHERVEDNILSKGERCHRDPFETLTDPDITRVAEVAEHIQQAFFDLEPTRDDEALSSPAVGKSSLERIAQSALLRDLFGNVFRPATFSPEWRTDTVLSLAKEMYESRDFSAMPILADALQDAGCDSDGILEHCRDEKQVHVRGCWVVDQVLGKS